MPSSKPMTEQTITGPSGFPNRRDRSGDGRPVVVIGGGVAGLVAALGARRHGAPVVLVEPHPLGGRARTDRVEGFTFNRGPRALIGRGPAHRVLRPLGVDLRTGGRPAMAGATVHVDGALRPLSLRSGPEPSGYGPGGRRAMGRLLAAAVRRGGRAEGSLADWLDDRRADGRPRQVIEAMTRLATYAHVPDELPASVALAQLRAAALGGVRYLDGGFGSIVARLEVAAAQAGVVVVREQASSVTTDGDVVLVATTGEELVASAAVLAVGGPTAVARLLGAAPAGWPELGPPARAACLELGVARVPDVRFALGLDRPTYLSVHAPPADLAPPGHAVVHLLRYRAPGEDLDHRAGRAELEALAALAGIDEPAIVAARYLHDLVVTPALPTVAGGGLDGRPPVVGTDHPGILLAGDWVGGTGLLLDAAAASGQQAGERAAARHATMVRT